MNASAVDVANVFLARAGWRGLRVPVLLRLVQDASERHRAITGTPLVPEAFSYRPKLGASTTSHLAMKFQHTGIRRQRRLIPSAGHANPAAPVVVGAAAEAAIDQAWRNRRALG